MYYPFNPLSHYNKFGYYRVGTNLTYSKWEALQISSQTKSPVEWVFNDDEYGRMDWTNEPQETLSGLYRRRAQQIRDQYDYVVIMYSGGADSHNVLMSFLENGISVDEVAHMVELEGDRDPDSFANAEIVKVAWPVAKNLITEKCPTAKHRVIDITQIILDLPVLIDSEEYITATSAWMTPANMARSFLRERIPEYINLIAAGKKLCFVWGGDKPNLAVLNDIQNNQQNYAIVFSDRESCLVSPRQKYLARPWEHDEFFYWSPDLPELVCKQAHILKNLLKIPRDQTFPGHYSFDFQSQFRDFGWTVQNQKLCVLSKDAGHTAIYPYWDISTFTSGKTVSRVFSARDKWLFKDISATSTGNLFQSVVANAKRNIAWRGEKQGFAVNFSRIYPLEKINDISGYRIMYPYDN